MPELIKPEKICPVPRTQTIVVHIDKGRAFEGKDEDGHSTFEATDFDTKIEEFCASVFNEGGQVLDVRTGTAPEYLTAIIFYLEKEQIEFLKKMRTGLAVPMPSMQENSLRI